MDWQTFSKIFTLLCVVSIASSQGLLEPAINAANGLRDRIGSTLDAIRNGKPVNLGFIQIPGRNGYKSNMDSDEYGSDQQITGYRTESGELTRDTLPYGNGYSNNHHPHGGPPGRYPGRRPPGQFPYERQPGRYSDRERYPDEGPPDRYPEQDRYPYEGPGRYPDGRPPGHHHHHHHHHHPPPDDFHGPPPPHRAPYDRAPYNGRPDQRPTPPYEFETDRPKPNFGDHNYNRINITGGLVLNDDYDETDTRNGNNIVGYLNKFPVILLKDNEIR